MATKKVVMTELDFKKYILEAAAKYMNLGDPVTDVKMNTTDKEKMTDGSSPSKSTSSSAPDVKLNFEKVEDTADVKMNQNDKEQGQVKQEGAALAGVGASDATKTGASIEGQHKATTEIKTEGPGLEESKPFDEKAGEIKMEKMDKEGDSSDKAKTFVGPGSEVGSGFKTGGHKAEFSEAAKNDKEKAERIATGIELKEGFQFKNKKELLEYINKEAEKIAQVL